MFKCLWLQLNMPAEMRPDRSKVLAIESDDGTVHLDELAPGALESGAGRRKMEALGLLSGSLTVYRFGGFQRAPRWYGRTGA